MILDLPRFIEGARPVWTELEQKLSALEDSPNSGQLSIAEAEHFYRLYQQTSAHLAEVRHLTAERELRGYLENLVARCYARIYVRGRTQRFRPLQWFTQQFPATVRRHARALALSVAILLAGSLFGAIAIRFDEGSKTALMPFGHLKQRPSERVKREMEEKAARLSGNQGRFSAQLMTHNTQVAIFTLGLGMTFAIGTIASLFYNGVILGAVAMDYVADGQAAFLMGWLLPHGSVEIPAILLAGQGGLLLGHALIGWGTREPRRLRLRRILPDLVTIAGGVAIMLIWAGLIESFFSQYHEPILPYAVKIAFGVAQLCALGVFLARSGRGHESAL